jgi:hypothetical protein
VFQLLLIIWLLQVAVAVGVIKLMAQVQAAQVQVVYDPQSPQPAVVEV